MSPSVALVLLALVSPPPAAELSVDVRARAFEPGEIVRVVARVPDGVTGVDGTLRGEALDFVDQGDGTWSAWGVLELDWPAGQVPVAVTARRVEGAPLSARASVELAAKQFPQSVLKVEGKYVDPPKAEQARIAREQAKLAKIYASRRAIPAPKGAFVRPVPGEPTSVFGARRVFNGQKRAAHPGLDLRAATGTPVLNAGPGRVVLAEDLYFSGNTVIVDHGGGLFTVYAHLSRIDVDEGAEIDPGVQVGLSGATGRVTGPHLHWGGKLGKRIFDPTGLLSDALFR